MDKEGLMLKYFVLNPNKKDAYGKASRYAIVTYAERIKKENPKFAEDLYNWMEEIIGDITGGEDVPKS